MSAMERRNCNAVLSAEKLPADVRELFAKKYNANVDMDLTFAIWQAMMLNITGGVLLTRADFSRAWRRWEECPKMHPLMTLIVDTEEVMASAILLLEAKKIAA